MFDRATPRRLSFSLIALPALCAGVALRAPASADEGMWLFNDLPLRALAEKYDFEPPPGWTDRLMRASVRLSSGGSGSIVSARGLVLTNHHVGVDALQKLSTPERNLVEDGFVAATLDDELKCPDLEVIALEEIVDVTDRVEAAASGKDDPGARNRARQEAIAAIAAESQEATGLQSDVVTLYNGGAYHLYRYRRYEDVRLVMAPETDVAFFGGDPDNFEFPRYCLDFCFFRIYEDGRPLTAENYLPWSREPPRAGDLVFVSGHPGRTERLNTLDHLRYLRDVLYPDYLRLLARREIALQQFSLRDAEAARIARDDLFGIQNARKALRGMLAGLLDPALFDAKAEAEAKLRAFATSAPAAGASLADWEQIRSGYAALGDFRRDLLYLEGGRAFWSGLFDLARLLVRLVAEKEKPNVERLPGFRDSDMARLEQRLYSPAPIHADLEKAKLADSLTDLAGMFGGEHPITRLILAGKVPSDRAAELVNGTGLADVEYRRRLAAGGEEAIASSADPLIRLAAAVDDQARAVEKKYEALIEGPQSEAYGRIADALFAQRGRSVYPDATFTLRLAFGTVRGWEEDGREIPHATMLGGLFEKNAQHAGKDPYALPSRWLDARPRLDLSVPLNFVGTPDIVGGNSGSPVVNRRGEIVGLIFDGNTHSLVWDLAYSDEKARCVSVAATAVIETLRGVFGQEALVRELLGE